MGAAYSMEAGSCEPFAAAHEQAAAMEQHLRSAEAMGYAHLGTPRTNLVRSPRLRRSSYWHAFRRDQHGLRSAGVSTF